MPLDELARVVCALLDVPVYPGGLIQVGDSPRASSPSVKATHARTPSRSPTCPPAFTPCVAQSLHVVFSLLLEFQSNQHFGGGGPATAAAAAGVPPLVGVPAMGTAAAVAADAAGLYS